MPTNTEDSEFVKDWWRKLLPLLLHYMLEGTNLAPAIEWPEPPVVLEDTPVDDADMAQILEDTQVQYEAEQEKAEADIQHLVDEMGKASKKARKRLVLELHSSQPGSSSSSTSISIPLPKPQQQVAMHLRLKVETNNTDAEEDGVGLVQTCQGFWDGPIPPLLGVLPDQLRHRILDLLRQRVKARWSGVLYFNKNLFQMPFQPCWNPTTSSRLPYIWSTSWTLSSANMTWRELCGHGPPDDSREPDTSTRSCRGRRSECGPHR